jgi:hypothetical protein
MKNVTFVKHKAAHGKVVFVDGVGHSGKTLLSPILSTYKKVEIPRFHTIFDHLAVLFSCGKISQDAVVAILKNTLDESLCDLMIGRNVNFRPTDMSSAFLGGNFRKYVNRLFEADGDSIIDRIMNISPIYQVQTHEVLGYPAPFFAAFGSDLRFVEVIRHPTDLIMSWIKRGWGGARFTDDARSFILSFDYFGQQLPYYAYSFRDDYFAMGELERVLNCINSCVASVYRGYDSLSSVQKNQVLLVNFDSLALDTHGALLRVSKFLDIEKGENYDLALREQNVPRQESRARDDNTKSILEQLPINARKLFSQMLEDFERFSGRPEVFN